MMSNSESRKRLDESTARPESGEVAAHADGAETERFQRELEDWLTDNRWDHAYDLSHAIAGWLARRDEKRDREAVGRVVERVRPPAWSIPADLLGGQVGDWVEVIRLDDIRKVLAEIEGA